MNDLIYKISPAAPWRAAEAKGTFTGAPIDKADGYIHFSDASTVRETARKYFAGATDLLLIAVDPASLGSALKWEVSRGGVLFPHLYADLPVSAVKSVVALPLDSEGHHIFPATIP